MDGDTITDILERSDELVKASEEQWEAGRHSGGFAARKAAVYGYTRALFEAIDEDDELIHAIEDCLVINNKILDRYKRKLFDGNDDQPPTLPSSESSSCSSSNSRDDGDTFQKLFEEKRLPWKAGTGFSGIIGLAGLKEILYSCTLMLPGSEYSELFGGGDGFNQHTLLFGVPGTGKTAIVHRYHEEARGMHLFVVTPADILSRWIGNGEKSLQALFEVAERNTPSIIFFDEIDGLFSVLRRDGNNIALLNQFLQHLQETRGVQVIGASNYPWELPESVLRRFQHIVHVPLPNFEERLRIIKMYLGKNCDHFVDSQLRSLAQSTQGYSASDILRASKVALRAPHKAVLAAEFFRKRYDSDGSVKWFPCSEESKGAKKIRFSSIKPANKIGLPKLRFADVQEAFQNCKKTSIEKDEKESISKKTYDFAKSMGTDGRGTVRVGIKTSSAKPLHHSKSAAKTSKPGMSTSKSADRKGPTDETVRKHSSNEPDSGGTYPSKWCQRVWQKTKVKLGATNSAKPMERNTGTIESGCPTNKDGPHAPEERTDA